ncbi:hypothetical protein H0H92_010100 [Tricholoma furcatifolium]|nr:hypothetical protein H0H92_010100 [Tricholoma furcatifolium]
MLDVIGAGYHPHQKAKVELEEEGAGMDLGHVLVKALKQRAEAWEGWDKWDKQRRTWKARGQVARAAGRCRKMVMQNMQADGGNSVLRPVMPKPKLKPPVKPALLSLQPAMPSHVLDNLCMANNAAEAEVKMQHELKDTVDVKLLA